MINFLNDIRNAENPISNNRKLINTIAILFLGIALGTFSKYLDFRQTELPGVLMAINGVLDIGNFLGRFAIWILIALCISIYSNSAIRASINVFVFFVGMVASYYLYSNYIAGFFPRSYAMIWFGFTAVSPLLAFVCWYAKGKSKLRYAAVLCNKGYGITLAKVGGNVPKQVMPWKASQRWDVCMIRRRSKNCLWSECHDD